MPGREPKRGEWWVCGVPSCGAEYTAKVIGRSSFWSFIFRKDYHWLMYAGLPTLVCGEDFVRKLFDRLDK
jgi:hypothetical protein